MNCTTAANPVWNLYGPDKNVGMLRQERVRFRSVSKVAARIALIPHADDLVRRWSGMIPPRMTPMGSEDNVQNQGETQITMLGGNPGGNPLRVGSSAG